MLNPRLQDERSNTVHDHHRIRVVPRDCKDEVVSFMPSSEIVPISFIPVNGNIVSKQRLGTILNCKNRIVARKGIPSPESAFIKTIATS